MEKEHYYRVTWITKTTKSVGYGRIETERSYSRECSTEEEAVKKARQVSRNVLSHSIRIAEMEYWNTPDPAPNGTVHVSLLGWINWRA